MSYDYLVVGAGFAGATLAERLNSVLGARVLVIDKRDHVAGNCHDPIGADGLRRHAYGPHIFHTNSAEVVAYLSTFTGWRPYEHRVRARIGEGLFPIPINRTTVNAFYGLDLDTAGVAAFLAARAVPHARVKNSEHAITTKVGSELYAAFFRGYTRKHWGLDPSELDASVCGRIPVRTNDDDRYFNDRFQCMPDAGYTALIERMLSGTGIDVALGVDFESLTNRDRFRHIVYTGPIDAFFSHRFGRLPYRSLRFEFETVDRPWVQAVGCINEAEESVPYTRVTEYKHLTGQQHARTVISREYACSEGEPYYPIPRPENRALYDKYAQLAAATKGVTFVGRLAEYRYYNMDQAVASALRAFEELAAGARLAS